MRLVLDSAMRVAWPFEVPSAMGLRALDSSVMGRFELRVWAAMRG